MRSFVTRAVAALSAAVLAFVPAVAGAQGAQRVYLLIADSVPMSVPAAATAIATALSQKGWTVLADHAVGAPAGRCTFGAHVVVAHKSTHAAPRLALGPQAAYAVPVRIVVFDDETGVHAAMVNPLNIDRTIVSESGLEASGRALIEEIAALTTTATKGHAANRAYGQSRSRGLIGKTMGVMAGGAFTGQIKTLTSVEGATAADLRKVADDTWSRLQQPSRGKWQLHGIYRLDLLDQNLVILGVSGAAMEAKAFDIVGAGDDDSRSKFKCPGVAYAAAFPLEVVIRRDGAQVKTEAVDAMFRMKMYFEDAGQLKFARNMLMPGSIADELKGLVQGRSP